MTSWIQFECFENKNQNRYLSFVHWILVNQFISFFWLTMSKIEKMYKPSKAHEQDFWHVFVIKVCFGNSPRCCQTCTVFICSLAGAIPKIIPIYIGLKDFVKTYQCVVSLFVLSSTFPCCTKHYSTDTIKERIFETQIRTNAQVTAWIFFF